MAAPPGNLNSVRKQVKFGSKKNSSAIECELIFDDPITAEQYGKLVVETMKYVVYTRGQIPLQYDSMLYHLKLQNLSHDALEKDEQPVCQKRNHHVHKKVRQAALNLVAMLDSLENLFTNYKTTKVQEVVVIFGATPVSPKNTFVIRLPPTLPTSNNGTVFRRYLLQMFRRMMMSEELAALQDIAPTNMFLFVRMNHRAGNERFRPKPDFRPLIRGKVVNFTMKSSACSSDGESVNSSCSEVSELDKSNDPCTFSRQDANRTPVESDEFMWFQSSVTMKGFTEVETCE